MSKEKRIKQLIMDEMVIKAISPWDGEARFDCYSVIIHKYDNEDLSLMNDNDPRISYAADRILKLIDPTEWDRLLEYYRTLNENYDQPDGPRNARPRGGRK